MVRALPWLEELVHQRYVRGLAAANVPVSSTSPPRQSLPGTEALAWRCAAVGALVRAGPLPPRLSLFSPSLEEQRRPLSSSPTRSWTRSWGTSQTPMLSPCELHRTKRPKPSEPPSTLAKARKCHLQHQPTLRTHVLEQDATTSWLKLPQITENELSPNGYGPPPSWMNPMFRHFSTPRVRHPRTSDEERCSSRDTLASVPNECFICPVWKIASSGSVSTAKSGGITVLRSYREAAQAQTPDSALPWGRCLQGAWSAHFRLLAQTQKEVENGGQVRTQPELGNRRQQLRWRKCVAPETHCSRDVQSRSRKGFAHSDRAKWLPPRPMQRCWDVHTRCDRHALRGSSYLQHVFLGSRCVCDTRDRLSTDHFDPAKTRHEGSGTERSAGPVVRTNPSAGFTFGLVGAWLCKMGLTITAVALGLCCSHWGLRGALRYWSRTKAAHTGPRSRRQRGLRPRHLGAILPRNSSTQPLNALVASSRTRSTRGSRLWRSVLCGRNLFSKMAKHASQAGVRWRVIVISDSGLRVGSGVLVKKCPWSAWGYPDNSFSRRKDETWWLGPRKKIATSGAGVRKRWKCAVVDGVLFAPPSGTETLSFRWRHLPDWNESCTDFTTMSRDICLGSKMSTYSTYCRRSTTIAKSPLARNVFPPNQNVKTFHISTREPCCCCKWVKLGGQRTRGYNIVWFLHCWSEYGMVWISAL